MHVTLEVPETRCQVGQRPPGRVSRPHKPRRATADPNASGVPRTPSCKQNRKAMVTATLATKPYGGPGLRPSKTALACCPVAGTGREGEQGSYRVGFL